MSKRLGSRYRSGRVDHWLKINSPMAPGGQARARGRLGRPAQAALKLESLKAVAAKQAIIDMGNVAFSPLPD